MDKVFKQDEEYFMRQALCEAQQAFDIDEVPVGCVVECKGKIIARGHNMSEHLNDATSHAEMQALTAAQTALGGKILSDCTLYVTLEPCVMCAGACAWTQIGRVVYGAKDEKMGASLVGKSLYRPKTKVKGGVLEKQAKDLLQEFFKAKRK
jgi:Cytosine/adenosine deaminases